MLRSILVCLLIMVLLTRKTWKVSKFGVFRWSVVSHIWTEYKVSHCIQFEYGNLQTRESSEFGFSSRSDGKGLIFSIEFCK